MSGPYPPRNLSISERLEYSTIPEPNSGCHLWMGSIAGGGYGRVRIKGHSYGAHRLAWIETRGAIPEGFDVLHKCDVRSCCNPQHLFLGKDADNIADMVAKGRHRPRGFMPKALRPQRAERTPMNKERKRWLTSPKT